jgi:hypothetical protein
MTCGSEVVVRALPGSTITDGLTVLLERLKNRIVLLCESLSSNITWTYCFSRFQSFEKTSTKTPVFYEGRQSFNLFQKISGYEPVTGYATRDRVFIDADRRVTACL